VAAVVAELGLAASQAVMLKRAARAVVLPVGTIAVIALAGGGAVAVGLALPLHPLIGVVVASIVYFVALKLFRRFPPEVREVLAGWIGPGVR
jgi:hypothetical protein